MTRAPLRASRLSRNKPIIAVVAFNLLTLLVFATAPVEWETRHLCQLYLLVSCCQVLLVIGFRLGRRSGPGSGRQSPSKLSAGDRWMDRCLVFYVSTFLVGYAYRTGFSILDVAGMYRLLLDGVANRAYGYEMALRGTGLGPIPWSVYFILSIPNQVFFIAGSFQWTRMNVARRVLFVTLVCVELLFSAGRGTAFGVVSLATTVFLSSMLWRRSGEARQSAGGLRNLLLLSFLFLGSVVFFAYNLYGRSGNVQRRAEQYEFGRSVVVATHPILAIVPEPLQPSYMNVVSYLCQGYYHTSLAFDLDFQSTWLLGSNPALIGLASVLGVEVWDRTYMHRLEAEAGVDQLGSWHSAYTWYACDVSYFGVPVVLFVLGYLFGVSWANAVRGDFVSRIMFVIFGNMLLFLFANNTYLSTVFYAFMFLAPYWIFTRVIGATRTGVPVGLPAFAGTVRSVRRNPMTAGGEASR